MSDLANLEKCDEDMGGWARGENEGQESTETPIEDCRSNVRQCASNALHSTTWTFSKAFIILCF